MKIYLTNKLKRNDNPENVDFWKVTEIDSCLVKRTGKATLSDRRVDDVCNYIVLIPFGNFNRYETWKTDTSNGYTISQGDFIFLKNPGTVTAQNIATIHNQMGDDSIEVKNYEIAKKRFDVNYEIKVTG